MKSVSSSSPFPSDENFANKSRIQKIKILRSMLGLGLKEAVDFLAKYDKNNPEQLLGKWVTITFTDTGEQCGIVVRICNDGANKDCSMSLDVYLLNDKHIVNIESAMITKIHGELEFPF